MTSSGADSRRDAWIVAACCVLAVVPLLIVRHLPLVDLPQHLAAIATIAHQDDPRWSTYFTVGLGRTSYLGFYAPGVLLTPLLGVEWAARVVVILAVGALPASVAVLLRAFNRPAVAGALSVPVCINVWVMWGFANFVMAIPIAFFALASFRWAQKSPRAWAAFSVLALLTFYAHPQMYLWLAAACLVVTLVDGRHVGWPLALRHALMAVAASIPSALAALWWITQSDVIARGEVGARGDVTEGGVQFSPLMHSLENAYAYTFRIWLDGTDEPIALAFLVVIAVLLVLRVRARAGGPLDLEMVLLTTLALYFAGPGAYRGIHPLSQRYLVVAVALLPVFAPRVLSELAGKIVRFGALLLAVTALITHGPGFVLLDGELADLDEAIAHAEPGRKLLGLSMEPHSQYAVFPTHVHAAQYYQARQGGHASWSFAELQKSPIHYREGQVPPEFEPNFLGLRAAFKYARYRDFFDYYLVRQPADVRIIPFPPPPEGPRLVYEGPRWQLFERAR